MDNHEPMRAPKQTHKELPMNPLSNTWQHPRTSAAGVLIAVLTAAGVLSQQGITLGKAGTGSVVTLIGGLATAFLGLVARDPSEPVPQAAQPQQIWK
jgi:hypothetical protein